MVDLSQVEERRDENGELCTPAGGGPEKEGVLPAWMTLITESPNPHGGFSWPVGVRGVNPGVSPEEVSARNQRLIWLDRSYCLGKPGSLIWTPWSAGRQLRPLPRHTPLISLSQHL